MTLNFLWMLKVILIGTHAIYKFARVEDLLPLIFDSLKVE